MAKRPPPGQCVHCLRSFKKLTWDHVFPLAWYPTTTPANIEKWKIPCCVKCNGIHAKSEGELFVMLGLCIDPDNPRNAGIVPRTLRALSPADGRNDKDARARAAHRQKILKQTLTGSEIPYQSVYPGFGPHPDVPGSERMALLVPHKNIERLAQKIVRGITYLEDKRFLGKSCHITVPVLADAEASPIEALLREGGQTFECGPGITVRRGVAPQDQAYAVYCIDIWGKLKIHAFVSPEADSPARYHC